MPWARAVIQGGIGTALLDYWKLAPIEADALAKASKGYRTEEEMAAEERAKTAEFAAAMTARFGAHKKKT